MKANNYQINISIISILAPMASTVFDFWRMIYEKNVKAIVMLANFYQMDKNGEYKVNCTKNE